jgi:hypothetical protein
VVNIDAAMSAWPTVPNCVAPFDLEVQAGGEVLKHVLACDSFRARASSPHGAPP